MLTAGAMVDHLVGVEREIVGEHGHALRQADGRDDRKAGMTGKQPGHQPGAKAFASGAGIP